MKGLVAHLFIAGLILAGTRSMAQYRAGQIDSLYSAAFDSTAINRHSVTGVLIYNASKAINYDKGMVEGLILGAGNSYSFGQYDKAFGYATQAENIAGKINDPVLTSKILTYKGLCYYRLGFYGEADQALQSAVPVAKTITDQEDMHYHLAVIYNDLAVNCVPTGNKTAKERWDKMAYAESEQLEKGSKYRWAAAITVSNRSARFTMHKQYDSAEFYCLKALRLANKPHHNYTFKENQARWASFLQAGDLYDAEKKFSGAEFYYQQAVNAALQLKYPEGLKKAYSGLAKVCTALNKTKEAAEYFEKSSKLSDSLTQADKAAIKAPLDYIVRGKEQQLAKNKSRDFLIIALICFLLIVTAFGVFFYRHRLKKEKKLSAEKLNELIATIELNEDKRSPAKMEELKAVVELAVNNSPAFLMKFNEFDGEFTPKLLRLNPTLIAVELEFCAMLRLNFGTKEIARYTKTSVRAVEGKKYRIRKKLSIASDQDINTWMTHL